MVCEGIGWTRVAYLNMSDPKQSCPPAWRDRSANGVRVCGQPAGSHFQCHSTFYCTSERSYSEVCGQVIGYQLDIQMPSAPVQLLISLMLKELASHMVIPDRTYGHWLQVSVKMIKVDEAVHVRVVRVPIFLLEVITTVNQDIMALVNLQAYTPVILSGMVQGVRVKVVAAALLHGSLWI